MSVLSQLVSTSDVVRSTASRLDKRAALAVYLSSLDADDLRRAASYLAGEVPQGALNVGWRLLRTASAPAPERPPTLFDNLDDPDPAPLTLADVDEAFGRLVAVNGKGAQRRREVILRGLFERATPAECDFLQQLVLGELRQGALRALVIDALAQARGVDVESLRRAIMVGGAFADVVGVLAREGVQALDRFQLTALTPVEPMLAATAEDLQTALTDLGRVAVEWKLDGMRIQLHKRGGEVRVFTRQLRDVTAQVLELAKWGSNLPARQLILDGEIVARDGQGQPLAFQDLMSVVSRESIAKPTLEPYFFDLLLDDDGAHLEDAYQARRQRLERLLPIDRLVPQAVVDDADQARAIFEDALAAGHEGIVLKALDAPYLAGRRGAHWRKHKPAVTVDLVILAAEWGHGRRRGFLSNIHLGARREDEPGRFAMLGKTFKGLTDAMLAEMTEDLLALETRREPGVVFVRPERVVEIAYDAVQRSSRYDSGLALRFARVKRLRSDKSPGEATSLEEIRALHDG